MNEKLFASILAISAATVCCLGAFFLLTGLAVYAKGKIIENMKWIIGGIVLLVLGFVSIIYKRKTRSTEK